ncbi:GA-binding protein subunit beta-2-like [Tropilaelaps mercedesae]|uniref:Alpha-latrotoxin n=1 Tax=Tropilaelaps mercedesae TaxID=418985 RepID=A0A1V9XQ54_9ACAR|nr:GA-binding protein subunit beta-2-like [Tropilaelaps mercedesae]
MANGAPFTADWLGTSPLHMAAASGHVETCEILLRAGCSRDARTKVDKTPLHLAAYEGHGAVVELLVKYGASLEARDMLLMTPLHWAVEKGHIDVIRTLLQFGASQEMVSKFELSPMDIALQSERKDIIELLQEYLVSPVTLNNAVASIFTPSSESGKQPELTPTPVNSGSEGPITVTMGPRHTSENTMVVRKVLGNHRVLKLSGQKVVPLDKLPQSTTSSRRLAAATATAAASGKDSVLTALEALEQAAGSGTVSEAALQFLAQAQGIRAAESSLQEEGSLVTSALESGQTIQLSHMGRLALFNATASANTPTEKIIIVNSTDDEDRISLQQQLEEMRREAERYKRALHEKEKEAEQYKKRLRLADDVEILPDDESAGF